MKAPVFSILSLGFWEHFDLALFSFLAPAVAEQMGVKSLSGLWGYGVFASAALTYPLGALLFMWMALRKGRGYALCQSVLGLGICTLGLALLPLAWGNAPIFLVFLRGLQGICVSGERALSYLYLLDQVPKKDAVQRSSQFQFSVMFGIFLALLASKWICDTQNWAIWHVLLGLSAFMLFIFYQQRRKNILPSMSETVPVLKLEQIPKTWNIKRLASITVLSAFSYVTYALVFQFFPAWLPLFSSYAFGQMLSDSVFLMGLDLSLFLVLPFVFKKYHSFGMLFAILCIFAIGWIPLLNLVFVYPFLFYTVRLLWMIAGVLYAIHLMVFLKQTVRGPFRYIEIGVWSLVGSALGHTTTFVCLWIFHRTHHILGTGIYLTLVTFMAWRSLLFLQKNR